MFENLSSSEWLLYISEWQHQNQSISNIRVTTKVAVHALLSNSIDLQTRGAAIIHNLACKEVKTVVCILPVQLTITLFFHFHSNSHLQPSCASCLYVNEYSHAHRIRVSRAMSLNSLGAMVAHTRSFSARGVRGERPWAFNDNVKQV